MRIMNKNVTLPLDSQGTNEETAETNKPYNDSTPNVEIFTKELNNIWHDIQIDKMGNASIN